MEMMGELSSGAVRGLIDDTLRLFVGQGRRLSFADLAAATGDNERRLRSYVEPDGPMMPLDVALRVFAVLPPHAFSRVARSIGFTAAPADAEGGATMRRAITSSAKLVAKGTAALEDGQIDHREMAELRAEAEELMPMLAAVVQGDA